MNPSSSLTTAGGSSSTGRSKYKCGICGQPKKGHICQALPSTQSQGDEDVSQERQNLLAKLQNRLGGRPVNDSPSPPDSSTSVGSPSQRVTIDIPAPAAGGGALLPASLDKPTLPSEAEAEQSEGRPMSMDLGGRPISMMSVDMTPASPSIMGGVPLWTPGTGEAQWLASPGTSMGGQQMWSTMPPVSPGTHGNMWVMPPSPSATLKVNSPSATAPVPVWSQAPPTAGSSTTPGWGQLSSTPWTTTPSAATPFWHSTPSGSVPQMWPE